jgi:hypothetical protein
MRVAEAAIAALEQQHALAEFGQVGNQRLVVFLEDLRADRHLQNHIAAMGAGAVAAHAVNAGFGLEVLLVAVVDQRVETIDGIRRSHRRPCRRRRHRDRRIRYISRAGTTHCPPRRCRSADRSWPDRGISSGFTDPGLQREAAGAARAPGFARIDKRPEAQGQSLLRPLPAAAAPASVSST